MNWLDRAIEAVSPARALERERARMVLQTLANYRSAGVERTSPSMRAGGGDADAAAINARRRLSLLSRDAVRNNALAERALQVVTNNVVGTGIHPKLVTADKALADEFLARVRATFDTTSVDYDGISTLAGLQRMQIRATAQDGGALLVWPDDRSSDFKVRMLEIDYLDDRLTGPIAASGNYLSEGIEYDPRGRVVAYHIYEEHPGAVVRTQFGLSLNSVRVDASRVIHLYRADRPGQRRGVSWFAPVLSDMVALADNDEAQLMRQKIAACFAAFWKTDKMDAQAAGIPPTLAPGLIQQIGEGDEVTFANPPDVTGYDDFGKIHLRRIAMGLGLTYEELTGDLSNVNFSSARLGRIAMGQNVEAWQWTMMIPRVCQPLGQWFLRSWVYEDPRMLQRLKSARIEWSPPPPVIADPKGETAVAVQRIEAGLSSRRREIRNLGYDAEDIDADITSDPLASQFLGGAKPSVADQVDQIITERLGK